MGLSTILSHVCLPAVCRRLISICESKPTQGFGGFSTLKKKRRPEMNSRGMHGDAFTGQRNVAAAYQGLISPRVYQPEGLSDQGF
jgi:hypothetical protein